MQKTRDDRAGAPSPEPELSSPPPAGDESGAPAGSPAPGGDPGAGAAPDAAAAGEIADLREKWLRAEADLQNFRRRARRETEEARRVAEDALLLDLASWLDDLERALESATEAGAVASWASGVALALQKGRDRLGRLDVTVVDPAGQPFDPNFHEAILEVEPPPGTAAGSVVQVVQKGYRRGERALRAARVIVARAESDGI